MVGGDAMKRVALLSDGGWGDFFYHLNAIRIFHNVFPKYQLHLYCSGEKSTLAECILPFVTAEPGAPARAWVSHGEGFDAFVYLKWLTNVSALTGKVDDYTGNKELYDYFDGGRQGLPLSLRQYFDSGLSLKDLVVQSWGLASDEDFVTLPRKDGVASATRGLPGRYVVVCNDADPCISVTQQTKQVPPPLWRMLLQLLVKMEYRVVELGVKVKSNFVHRNYLNLIGQTSAIEWAEILQLSSGILTIEGGTAHLAAVLGRPAMVLCGPTDSHTYGHSLHRYVNSGICSPCHWKSTDWFVRCHEGIDQACMYAFDPEDLVSNFTRMLD
jgi:hypothetical protein